MLITIFLILLAAGVVALVASVVMVWASSRSPLWNMFFGGILAFFVLAGAALIAFFMTRAEF